MGVKITKKIIENVFNDFKDSLFISTSLDKNKVNHYDFFEYLKANEDINKEYKKIEEYNNFILEDQVAERCYKKDGHPKILLEMIKANNKKKYTQKIEIENTSSVKEMSDEEIDNAIKRLSEKYQL